MPVRPAYGRGRHTSNFARWAHTHSAVHSDPHSAVHSELFPDTDDPDLDPDRDDAGNVGSEGPPYQNCSTEEL
jgi:hypothetical protein